MGPARAASLELIFDACSIALIGAGWLDFALDVHELDTRSPRVVLRVRVPWWRWWLIDRERLERHVWRCLISIASPAGRWVEYRVSVIRDR